MSNVLTPEKERLVDVLCATGVLRSNAEGNLPNYVASVLRCNYLGKPLDIMGFYLEVPQRTVIKKLEGVEVTTEVTKLGNIEVLHLIGDIEAYHLKRGNDYKIVNNSSSHERKYTKVLQVKSSESSRNFFVDAEIPFLEQLWD